MKNVLKLIGVAAVVGVMMLQGATEAKAQCRGRGCGRQWPGYGAQAAAGASAACNGPFCGAMAGANAMSYGPFGQAMAGANAMSYGPFGQAMAGANAAAGMGFGN